MRFRSHGLIIVALWIMAFDATPVVAQSTGPGYGDDVSLFIGSMLPNQIDGVTEILPVFGGRYGLSTSAGFVDFGLANTHAEGVDFTTLSLSLRGEIPAGDGISGIVYAGADLNWYAPMHSESRKTDTGLHIGAGAMMLVTESFWLRSELKFMGGPGTSLYLLFGAVFRGSP